MRKQTAKQARIQAETEARKAATYAAAKNEAQAKADREGRDIGLEWLGEGQLGYWRSFGLPNRENRQGHELFCEVVSCSDLSKTLAGHGPVR